MKTRFLKASNGDAILLSYNDGSHDRNILIDGGTGSTYSQKSRGKIKYNDLYEAIKSIKDKNEKIDLLILTHVDDDHIGGILKWFESDPNALGLINQIWFNSGRTIKKFFELNKDLDYDNSRPFNESVTTDTSIGQGVKFEEFISRINGVWEEELIQAGMNISLYGLDFKILSPDENRLKGLLGKWEKEKPESLDTSGHGDDYEKSMAQHIQDDYFEEDKSKHNGSSISFILTFNSKNYLFLADSFPSVVISSLKKLGYSEEYPLECEFVKVSHHGSKANNSSELLKLIDSKKYIISTNGAKHSHPNKQFLARLINLNIDCEIYFNYPYLIEKIFLPEDYEKFTEFRAIELDGSI